MTDDIVKHDLLRRLAYASQIRDQTYSLRGFDRGPLCDHPATYALNGRIVQEPCGGRKYAGYAPPCAHCDLVNAMRDLANDELRCLRNGLDALMKTMTTRTSDPLHAFAVALALYAGAKGVNQDQHQCTTGAQEATGAPGDPETPVVGGAKGSRTPDL